MKRAKYAVIGIIITIWTFNYAFAGGTEIDKNNYINKFFGSNGTENYSGKTTAIKSDTSYLDPDYNVKYICPAGWRIDSVCPMTGKYGGVVLYVRNPSYQSTMFIDLFKLNSVEEAALFGGMRCFVMSQIAYVYSSLMPGIYAIGDALDTITQGKIYHYTSIALKEKDENNLVTDVDIEYTQQESVYVHSIFYFPSISDYNLNDSIYIKNWLNLNFLDDDRPVLEKRSSPPLSTTLNYKNGTAIVSIKEPQDVKLSLFNIAGKKMSDVYNGTMSGSRSFNLSKHQKSMQPLFLLLKTREGMKVKKFIK